MSEAQKKEAESLPEDLAFEEQIKFSLFVTGFIVGNTILGSVLVSAIRFLF